MQYEEQEFWGSGERPTMALPHVRRSGRDDTSRLSPSGAYGRGSAQQFRRRRTAAVAGVLAVALIGVVSITGGDGNDGNAIAPLAPQSAGTTEPTANADSPGSTLATEVPVDEADAGSADAAEMTDAEAIAAAAAAPRAAARTSSNKTVSRRTPVTRRTTAPAAATKRSAAKKTTSRKTTTTTNEATASTVKRRATTTTTANTPATPRPTKSTLVSARTCRNGKYRVRKGDSWIAIARKATTNLNAVLRANGATARTPVYVGMTVCLPAKAHPVSTTSTVAAKPKPTTPTTKPRPTTTTTTTTKPRPATTAPKPTTTSSTRPATTVPRKNNYTQEEIKQIIREVWPDDQQDKAIAIAWRESNWTPTVRNYCCFGLFQIYWNVHQSWLRGLGITSSDMLYDPRINATAALALYQRAGGWGPWSL